jgi:hypothetical protein
MHTILSIAKRQQNNVICHSFDLAKPQHNEQLCCLSSFSYTYKAIKKDHDNCVVVIFFATKKKQ